MTRALVVLVVLLLPRPAAAQDTPFRLSLVAAVAAHGADLATTEFCIGRGVCREMNPFLGRFDQPAIFGAVKMGIAAMSLWGTAKLHESHPTLAFTAIAIRNARVVQ